jgi:hypothetical protein
MSKKHIWLSVLQVGLLLFFITCNRSTEPKETLGSITGKVMNGQAMGMPAIHPAFIFHGDSLWATTDNSGEYSITAVTEGNYILLCSAINYRDTTIQVQVRGGSTVTCNFNLTPDSSYGWIRGEFQDLVLFNDSLLTHPAMANWDAQQIWQGTTGATMIGKFLQYNVPDRQVYLGDSLLTKTDDWALYSLKIQCGTYQFTGSCEGYYDANEVVKILPGTVLTAIYVNFFLMRKPTPKFVAIR